MSKCDIEIVGIEEILHYAGSNFSQSDSSLSSSFGGSDVDETEPADDTNNQDAESAVPFQSRTSVATAPGDPDRVNWGGKMEFLMTCIGYAVGLGNVWRFPYLCYKNGGGAFLIPYTLMLIAVGLPLFYMELAFGQFASLGPITIWRINPLFKGLGYAMVIVSWIISLYYNVIIAQIMFYLISSFTSSLPWTSCGNHWNTNSCLSLEYNKMNENGTIYTVSTPENGNATISMMSSDAMDTTTPYNVTDIVTSVSHKVLKTPAEEFYRYFVLEQSSGIEEFDSINWKLAGCLLLSWIIVGLVLAKGVQSLGKIVYFTAIFPYIMLTVLLIRGLTLDGAMDGIIYYVKPDFSRLTDPRVWSDAATQIFYSLSACSGGLIAMSSFSKFNNNCHRDAIIVAVLNCATSIFAGFVIFSILGFMAFEKGVDVADVAKGGPGLVFEVYPEALSRMVVAPMWAVFFFFMMATLGFGSEFSIVECVISALLDEFPFLAKSTYKALSFRIGVCVVCFLLGLPLVCNGGFYLLELVDYSVSGFPLLVVGLIECVVINWVYGFNKFWSDIQMMVGDKPQIYWKVTWKYVSPLVILLTIIMNIIFFNEPSSGGVPFPQWAQSLSWLIAAFPIVAIVAWFLFYYCKNGGLQLLMMRSAPLPEWGPALANNRGDIYAMEIAGEKPFGTLEYQLGKKIYRSHLNIAEIAHLLAGSSSTVSTTRTQRTSINSTMSLPVPPTVAGSNVSIA
ncbi:unnamed protein product [Lymnaea stagnalis]|uniref:Transporter n=1 Tax=Lymnaea stagnalis TaxID=6523 RepID=A0AAV2H4G7_LYMST